MPSPRYVPCDTGVELLTFEPLTLIPFQRKLIDASLLTHEEKKYLDDYHARVSACASSFDSPRCLEHGNRFLCRCRSRRYVAGKLQRMC